MPLTLDSINTQLLQLAPNAKGDEKLELQSDTFSLSQEKQEKKTKGKLGTRSVSPVSKDKQIFAAQAIFGLISHKDIILSENEIVDSEIYQLPGVKVKNPQTDKQGNKYFTISLESNETEITHKTASILINAALKVKRNDSPPTLFKQPPPSFKPPPPPQSAAAKTNALLEANKFSPPSVASSDKPMRPPKSQAAQDMQSDLLSQSTSASSSSSPTVKPKDLQQKPVAKPRKMKPNIPDKPSLGDASRAIPPVKTTSRPIPAPRTKVQTPLPTNQSNLNLGARPKTAQPAVATSTTPVKSLPELFPYGKISGEPEIGLPSLEALKLIDNTSNDFHQKFDKYTHKLGSIMDKLEKENKLPLWKNVEAKNVYRYKDSVDQDIKLRYANIAGVKTTAVGDGISANLMTICGINFGTASQHPTASQIKNHMALIKEKRCPLLVVLTAEEEMNNGKNEVTNYTPYFRDENYAKIPVTKDGVPFANHTETKKLLADESSKIVLYKRRWVMETQGTLGAKIIHAQGWKDRAGMNAEYLVELANTITKEYSKETKAYSTSSVVKNSDTILPLIHCKAGVGRTGTLFATLAMAYLPKDIPLIKIIEDLRLSRNGAMVQTNQQHATLAHIALAQGRPLY